MIFAALGLIFQGVAVEQKSVSIQPGPLIPSFGILHTTTIIAGLTVLLRKFLKSRGKTHTQLAFVFYGILVSFTLTFLITFILPIVLKNTVLLAISPLFLALSVIVVAYAIISHKLFDIRAAVARSVAYALSIGTLVFIYVIVPSFITNNVLANYTSRTVNLVVSTFVFMLAVILYPSQKKFFDKITSKIFYRDSYDIQEVLDQLGSAIVAEINLHKLIHETKTVMSGALKSNFIEFVLFKEESPYFETDRRKNVVTGLKELGEHIKEQHKELVITDELNKQNNLKRLFEEMGSIPAL